MLDKLKELTKDTAIYGISTMVGRFLNFLLVPFYTNIFPPVQYGIVNQVYALILIVNVILLFGMDTAYMKNAVGVTSNDEKKNIFSTPYLTVAIVSFFLCMIIVVLERPLFSLLEIPTSYYYLIYYTGFILFLDSMTIIPFVKLRIERKARKFALYKFLTIVVALIMNFVLILKYKFGIEAILISNVVSSGFAFLLLTPTIFKSFKFHIDIPLLKKLLKFGLPFLPAGLSSMMIQGIDRPILTKLTNLNVAGIYSANYKLGIFMMLFVSMFQFAWQPFFFQHAEEKNIKQVFSKILTYFTVIACLVLVVLSLFIDDLIKIQILHRTLIGAKYWSGVVIVPIVLFGYVFNGIYYILSAGMFIKEKSLYIPIITGTGAFINVGVNFLLIPVYGIVGAALATLFAYFIMAVGVYFVTQRFYKIQYENSKILITMFFVLVAGTLYYYLFNTNNLLLIYRFLILAGYIISIFVFVIDKQEMAYLRKKLGLLR